MAERAETTDPPRRVLVATGGTPAHSYLCDPGRSKLSAAAITVAQRLQLWLDTRIGPGASTLRSYRQHIRGYLIPYLGDQLLGK